MIPQPDERITIPEPELQSKLEKGEITTDPKLTESEIEDMRLNREYMRNPEDFSFAKLHFNDGDFWQEYEIREDSASNARSRTIETFYDLEEGDYRDAVGQQHLAAERLYRILKPFLQYHEYWTGTNPHEAEPSGPFGEKGLQHFPQFDVPDTDDKQELAQTNKVLNHVVSSLETVAHDFGIHCSSYPDRIAFAQNQAKDASEDLEDSKNGR